MRETRKQKTQIFSKDDDNKDQTESKDGANEKNKTEDLTEKESDNIQDSLTESGAEKMKRKRESSDSVDSTEKDVTNKKLKGSPGSQDKNDEVTTKVNTKKTNIAGTKESLQTATPKESEVFSPRRSSRGFIPNRKFKDMESAYFGKKAEKSNDSTPKKKNTVKKTPQKKIKKVVSKEVNEDIDDENMMEVDTESNKDSANITTPLDSGSSSTEVENRSDNNNSATPATPEKSPVEKQLKSVDNLDKLVNVTAESVDDQTKPDESPSLTVVQTDPHSATTSTGKDNGQLRKQKDDKNSSNQTQQANKMKSLTTVTSADKAKEPPRKPRDPFADYADGTIIKEVQLETKCKKKYTKCVILKDNRYKEYRGPPKHELHSVEVGRGKITTSYMVYPTDALKTQSKDKLINSTMSNTDVANNNTIDADQVRTTSATSVSLSLSDITSSASITEVVIEDHDVSKLKSVLLSKEDEDRQNKEGTGTLIKESLALLDEPQEVEEDMVIVDTPVLVSPKISDPSMRRPGKIVKSNEDRTICVNVSGKSSGKSVVVQIPDSCSPMTLFDSNDQVRSPTKSPRHIILPPLGIKGGPKKTEDRVDNSEASQDTSSSSSSQITVLDTIKDLPIAQAQVIDNVELIPERLESLKNVVEIQGFDINREIKTEMTDRVNAVNAETQTTNIGKGNVYKKVIREIAHRAINNEGQEISLINSEEVIMVELPKGMEIKKREVTTDHGNEPEFVTIDEHGLHQCRFCTYATYKKTNWYKHKAKHIAMRSHKCPQCSYRAATSSNLKRHLAIHSDTRDFQCEICHLNFRQKIHLERHLKYKHEEKTVQCPLCPYVCANENPDLRVHIKRRHVFTDNMNAHTCTECGLVTVSKKDLRQHMKFHRKGPELKLFCEHCSFVTDCESRLRRHMFIHTKEKPFQCGLCEYRGSQKEHVLRHMKSQHDVEIERSHRNRSSSTPSSNAFNNPEQPQEVVISNSGEKADYSSEEKIFACNHCTMKFSKLINLYKHLHTQHKGVMPNCDEEFTCVVCDFRTNNKKNLLVHMRKHNAQDQSPPSHVYSCVLCRYMNPRRRNLFQHMRKKHHIEIVVKDDGTANCYMADATTTTLDNDQQLQNVMKQEIEIVTDSINNVISLEDIAMVVSNPLSNNVSSEPITITSNTSTSSNLTSVSEYEAAEAIEGLQALAEQAGLVETLVDNVIEEPVQDITIPGDNDLLIDETVDTFEQKTDDLSSDLAQNIQLSPDQLLNLTSGDFVEINGEMYKVEISSEEKDAIDKMESIEKE